MMATQIWAEQWAHNGTEEELGVGDVVALDLMAGAWAIVEQILLRDTWGEGRQRKGSGGRRAGQRRRAGEGQGRVAEEAALGCDRAQGGKSGGGRRPWAGKSSSAWAGSNTRLLGGGAPSGGAGGVPEQGGLVAGNSRYRKVEERRAEVSCRRREPREGGGGGEAAGEGRWSWGSNRECQYGRTKGTQRAAVEVMEARPVPRWPAVAVSSVEEEELLEEQGRVGLAIEAGEGGAGKKREQRKAWAAEEGEESV